MRSATGYSQIFSHLVHIPVSLHPQSQFASQGWVTLHLASTNGPLRVKKEGNAWMETFFAQKRSSCHFAVADKPISLSHIPVDTTNKRRKMLNAQRQLYHSASHYSISRDLSLCLAERSIIPATCRYQHRSDWRILQKFQRRGI
ncbi:putative 26S proteasome regulatory subunit rpn3 [Fusarium oxysporum f. sp. albedinis]|nr:putative 26S proteasome regulatory subunit rpn3 [Fusarium oxysporum f. sp. albedinis]